MRQPPPPDEYQKGGRPPARRGPPPRERFFYEAIGAWFRRQTDFFLTLVALVLALDFISSLGSFAGLLHRIFVP